MGFFRLSTRYSTHKSKNAIIGTLNRHPGNYVVIIRDPHRATVELKSALYTALINERIVILVSLSEDRDTHRPTVELKRALHTP